MKKVFILVFSFLMAFQCFATPQCALEYENEIQRYVQKVERTRRAGRITTGVTFTTMTAFWGTMGVILVGPAGVLIGLQFGLFTGGPVGGGFYVVKKVKEKKLKSIMQAYSVIQASYELADSNENELIKLFSKLKKEKPELTLEELKSEIINLDSTKVLCDGSIKKNPLRFKQLFKYLKKTL